MVGITTNTRNVLDDGWNGNFLETFDFTVSSDGSVITGSLEQTGTGNLTMNFSDGRTILDTTPKATITLTAGTATNPQTNYVYVLQSNKTLTVSTSDWPVTEHIKVATIVLLDAGDTQTNDAIRNQNWNDHTQGTNNQGHILHIAEKLRNFEAQWSSGAAGTLTIVGASTPDDVYVSNTAGVVYQMHRQTFTAMDTAVSDVVHIVNHNSTPYVHVSNLNGQTSDANGNSLTNSSFSFVLWGVANKTGEASQLMLNLPVGKYGKNQPGDAVSDALNYSVYDIPTQFQGVGFLIARFTLILDAAGQAWTLHDTEDLRGKIPNVTAGGGAGGLGVTTFLELTDSPSAYTGEALKVPSINTGETALEFTSTDDLVTRKVGIQVLAFDTDNSVSDSQAYFRVPSEMNAWNLTGVAANVVTAGTTGTQDVQIRRVRSGSSVDMLSTKITIDSAGIDSSDATTPAVINTSNDDVNTADQVHVDVDVIQTTPAKGLFVELTFTKP